MKSLALIVALASSGCFSTWAIGQASGKSLAWDEQKREETVPLPATEERLTIAVPLQGSLTLQCKSMQVARESVYRSSFRYGKGWKKMTALAFAAEAAAGTALLLTADREHAQEYAYGGFLALDALGTAALFFVPRKDQFTNTERDAITTIRDDCPDGLTFEIAGNSFIVDAAGHIGDAGEVALEDWMKAPTGALLVTLAGRTTELRIGDAERCSFLRDRDPQAACTGNVAPVVRDAFTVLQVPLGTLTAIAE